MKHNRDRKYMQIGFTAFCVLAALLVLFYAIFHLDSIAGYIGILYSVLTPIIYAAILSYILWPIIRFLEKRVIYHVCALKNWNPNDKIRKIIRMVCIFITLLLFFTLIYGLIAMLVPEILNSITNIIDNSSRYINNIEKWMTNLLKNYPELEENSTLIFNTIVTRLETWLTNELLPKVNSLVVNFTSGFLGALVFLKNFLLGALISIYLLFGKETYIAHGKQFLYALFKMETANNIIRDLQYVDRTFGGFIGGKIIDSLIIGVLCYIGTMVLNLPYALLVSVVVGVTNVIPFFGPYIGAIPSIFLILLVNPVQSLYFAVFILVLQQFDGNFLGPKILGGSTGLSSFMVIVAILVGGGMFGIVGMFIGVPICAVICTVIRNALESKLERKNLPIEVEKYQNMDHLDSETLEPVLHPVEKERGYRELFSSYLQGIRQKYMPDPDTEEYMTEEDSSSIPEDAYNPETTYTPEKYETSHDIEEPVNTHQNEQ